MARHRRAGEEVKRAKPGSLRYQFDRSVDIAKQSARAGVVAGFGVLGGVKHMKTAANVSDERHKGWAMVEGDEEHPGDATLLCPLCACEFFVEDGIDICPDCNVELIEQ